MAGIQRNFRTKNYISTWDFGLLISIIVDAASPVANRLQPAASSLIVSEFPWNVTIATSMVVILRKLFLAAVSD